MWTAGLHPNDLRTSPHKRLEGARAHFQGLLSEGPPPSSSKPPLTIKFLAAMIYHFLNGYTAATPHIDLATKNKVRYEVDRHNEPDFESFDGNTSAIYPMSVAGLFSRDTLSRISTEEKDTIILRLQVNFMI